MGKGSGDLDIVNHSEDVVLVDAGRVLVGMENRKADALEHTRDSLARINVLLVEARQNALEIVNLFAVLEELGKVLARHFRWDGIVRQKQGQCRLLRNVATPLIAYLFYKTRQRARIYIFFVSCRDVRSNT